jgi:hypothetical protein
VKQPGYLPDSGTLSTAVSGSNRLWPLHLQLLPNGQLPCWVGSNHTVMRPHFGQCCSSNRDPKGGSTGSCGTLRLDPVIRLDSA